MMNIVAIQKVSVYYIIISIVLLLQNYIIYLLRKFEAMKCHRVNRFVLNMGKVDSEELNKASNSVRISHIIDLLRIQRKKY